MAVSRAHNLKIGNRTKGAVLVKFLSTTEAQAEITSAAQTAPDTTPLAILARRIREVGYLKNMELIASGRGIGRVTPALAEAILCESKGTHKHWHICQCDRDEMQRHAARLLKAAFGIDMVVLA
jgi:hypothetical protein